MCVCVCVFCVLACLCKHTMPLPIFLIHYCCGNSSLSRHLLLDVSEFACICHTEISMPPPRPGAAPLPPQEIRTPPPPARPAPPVAPRISVPVGEDRTESIKGIQKAMVKTMSAALQIPAFGYYDDIDLTRLVAVRGSLKAMAEQRGVRFSYMPVFLKVGCFR